MTRIEHSRVLPYALPLKTEWRSAGGGFSVRSGCLLRLEMDDGSLAWGDCAPLTDGARDDGLLSWHHELRGLDAAQARARLACSTLGLAARCAVDIALADCSAQQAGVSLAHHLNPHASLSVPCNAALGALDESAAARARVAMEQGFTVLKLKVGLASIASELACLRELAATLPPGILLRLDANRAWNEPEARQFLAGLKGMPVEMLEEPLTQPDLIRLSELQRSTEIALALDESLPQLGMAPVMAAQAVRRLILKPMLLGGLSACLEWARQAREHGMACVATTTVDSAVGTLAAAHLAAALDNGLHHGLATSSWLERDVGSSPPIGGSVLRLEDRPGLGFSSAIPDCVSRASPA